MTANLLIRIRTVSLFSGTDFMAETVFARIFKQSAFDQLCLSFGSQISIIGNMDFTYKIWRIYDIQTRTWVSSSIVTVKKCVRCKYHTHEQALLLKSRSAQNRLCLLLLRPVIPFPNATPIRLKQLSGSKCVESAYLLPLFNHIWHILYDSLERNISEFFKDCE